MVLLLPPRRAMTADEIILFCHTFSRKLSATVPLHAAAATATSVISQVSLPIVGHGIVARHDGGTGYKSNSMSEIFVRSEAERERPERIGGPSRSERSSGGFRTPTDMK